MSKPTDEQIRAELATLKDYAPRIRQRNAFGDDNRTKIDAQIHFLSAYILNPYTDSGRYSPGEDGDNDELDIDEQFEVYNSVLDVDRWLKGEEPDTPSSGWEPLLVT